MIKKGFWKKLEDRKRPILAAAPMANVTDAAFRRMVAHYGKPDVFFTEFVSCEGLCSRGKTNLMRDLMFHKKERPVVAQLWGVTPKYFYECAKLVAKLGFDGIDINMGCPDKSVEKMGAGAQLMLNPRLAKKIIEETKRGAGRLPVSVKTRIGYDTIITKRWISHLLKARPAVITIHGRTRKEMMYAPVHWDEIAKAAVLAKKYATRTNRTLIIGNGDIKDIAEAKEKARTYGLDGVMVGRALIGNPWFFNAKKTTSGISHEEKIKVLLEHTALFVALFHPDSAKDPSWKHFDTIKKHYKAYVSGFPGASKMRARLMEAKSAKEVAHIVC
jgi:nifR3 family TIM-barrel protein